MDNQRVLDDWQARAAYARPDCHHAVLAVPGAGKTEVIAERVAWLIREGHALPSQIVALTFTRAMAADLSRRIHARQPTSIPCATCGGTGKRISQSLGIIFDCESCSGTGGRDVGRVKVGTLHAMCATWIRDGLKTPIVRDALRETGWFGFDAMRATGSWGADPDGFTVATKEEVEAAIAQAQADLGGAKKITKKALVQGLDLRGAALASCPRESQARMVLRSWGMVRYEDMLTLGEIVTSQALRHSHCPTSTSPWLIVDEAQDLSEAHERVISPWMAAGFVFMVGDDAQAIYGFLGGREGPSLFSRMTTTREVDEPAEFSVPCYPVRFIAHVQRLTRNYRSTQRVVDAADCLRACMATAGLCASMRISCVRADESGSVTERIVALPEGMCAGETGGACVPDVYVPEGVEPTPAAVVAAVDEALFMSDRAEDVVVLAATRAELDEVEEALTAAGIESGRLERSRDAWQPTRGRLAIELLRLHLSGTLDTRAMSAMVDLGVLTRAQADAAERRALTTGNTTIEALVHANVEAPGEGRWSLLADPTMPAADALDYVVEATGGEASPLRVWLDDMPSGASATPEGFLTWLASDETARVVRPAGKVCLSTMHGAKGLEWPRVVLVGTCEGALPPRFSRGDTAKEADWHRAVYVAVTRARDGLTCVTPRWLRGKPRASHRLLALAGVIADFEPQQTQDAGATGKE